MTTWFNAATDKFPFAKLGNLIDSTEVNSKVEFSEGIFRFADPEKTTIDCFLWAINVTDVKKAKENSWTFVPCALYFQIHSTPYSKYDNKEGIPTTFSKWLHSKLTELIGDGSSYQGKGFISFTEPTASVTAECLISGKKADGKDLSPDAMEFLAGQYLELTPIDTLVHLDATKLPDTTANSKGYGNRNYAPKQDESGRLTDRAKFVVSVISKHTPCDDLLTASSVLLSMSKDTPDQYLILSELIGKVLDS